MTMPWHSSREEEFSALTAANLGVETEVVAVMFVVTAEWGFLEVVLDFFEVDLDDWAKLWEIEKQTLRCTRARRVW